MSPLTYPMKIENYFLIILVVNFSNSSYSTKTMIFKRVYYI